MSKMNPVVHFEMPAENRKRIAEFYSNVFGWRIKQLGPEMGNYMVVSTSETDEKTMRPKEPGMIGGGFYQKTDDPISAHPSVVIAVDDIRESMKKISKAGGKILGGDPNKPGEPGDIPGVGLYCSFIDTEGNRVSMLQPNREDI
jgi:predicted enzyme related to lactoylglutathione lyase